MDTESRTRLRRKAGVRFRMMSDLDIYRPGHYRDLYPGLEAFPRMQRDQSCVGAVAAKVIEAQFLRQLGKTGALHPEFLWKVAQKRDSTPDDPRSGLHDAFSVAIDYGVPPADEPDASNDRVAEHLAGGYKVDQAFVTKTLKPLLARANERRIRSFSAYTVYYDLLKAHLRERGPLAVQLNVTPAFDIVGPRSRAVEGDEDLPTVDLQDGPGGKYAREPVDAHAIVVLEYVDRGNPKRSYFVVVNSYGHDWGNQGFAAITEAQAERSFVRAFGVELLPSYHTEPAKAHR